MFLACAFAVNVPIARNDTFTTRPNTTISGDLAGNDVPSADGGNVWTVVTPPSHGTVVVNPSGTFTYIPTPGYSGTDTFTYRITDSNGDTSTATVTLTIPGVCLAPVISGARGSL
jgi:VCBS repeat-containing protein